MPGPNLNIPNFLSSLRIALVPVLLLLAWYQHPYLFLGLLAFSLSTDGLDGYIARRFNQQTALGVKLDSWGDLFTYGVMVAGLFLLWPDIFRREQWFLLFGVGFYLLPTFASLYKFGELPRYHTWAAKLAALLMTPAYFLLTLADMSLLFRAVILFHVWVAIEEAIIVMTLRRNQTDVPSFIHARRLTRMARDRFQAQKDKLLERREERREIRDERRKERRNGR